MPQDSKRVEALFLYESALTAVKEKRSRDASKLLGVLLEIVEDNPELFELKGLAQELFSDARIVAQEGVEGIRIALNTFLTIEFPYSPPIVTEIEQVEAYLEEIDRLVDARITVWEEEAKRYLSAWEQVILDPMDEYEYAHYILKVNTRKLTLARKFKASGIIDLCEKLWTRAEALMNDASYIGAEVLLDHYYRPALDIARDALEDDAQNVNLIALLQKAEAEWERFKIGAQVLTSAVQAEEYSRSLKELEGLPADQPVPSYRFIPDDQGVLQARNEGYIAVSEARRRILKMAHDWAHSKALEYMDRAEGHLRKHELLSALDTLAERQKIEAFLESTDKDDFTKLQNRVDEELRRSKEAERLLDQALEQLPHYPLEAWMLYTRAIDTYAWARKSLYTRTVIVSQLQNLLGTRYREAEDAFNKRDFFRLKGTVEQTRDQFSRVDDPVVTNTLSNLTALESRGRQIGLEMTVEILLDEAEASYEQGEVIESFETRFNKIKNDPDYDTLQKQNRERFTVLHKRIETLKNHLTAITEVEKKVKNRELVPALKDYREELSRYEADLIASPRFQRLQNQLKNQLESEMQAELKAISEHYAQRQFQEGDKMVTEVVDKYGKLDR